ncbi:hypothetical protein QVZ41_10220 [Wenyingzhuangia sp. chi5]|uniref:Uncharacterized protein n=1 Tax=Wenyingzhuangia gilva TaxID=3057677 RepID=A0ABT8VTB6_9FLAO|nr:hypothetical protein [Wenyingzhuangia sp. chi5]MDO3695219.1 hypothetical protein [Wenyingzhuangia sp. chi5]
MKTNKKTNPILIAIVIALILLVPYFITFDNNIFSNKTEDWGAFGSYLGGIISVINLFVFIYISSLINDINENSNNRDINNQKLLTLTQFRQNELDKLTLELDKPTINDGSEEINVILSKLSAANIYLVNFSNQKSYLFPIIYEDETKELIQTLIDTICNIINLVKDVHGIELTEEQDEVTTKIFMKYLEEKTSLLMILQQFILKELD